MPLGHRRRSITGGVLDDWYTLIQKTIIEYQDPVTGLSPAFLFSDGSSTSDAWVRDNTYTSLCGWALSLAYKKLHDSKESISRALELEQVVVKQMRGLLFCMMRQVGKVEKFKSSQSKMHSLHAKYNRKTGAPAVGDHQWGHLQIDATSLYLIILAQMTASGLQIIYSLDEVAFVQNLVFYIEEAYRIPDYGIWERGDKSNNGEPELNASSIGMAKAALEALDGLDLFGSRGGPSSVIHILEDEVQQCNAKLESLLPRESSSKETDAALLAIIGYPAFAVEKGSLVSQVKEEILSKLQGKYGCKRFLRDGYQTVKEDPSRLYYHPSELKGFENIECEWPVFFAYLMIDGIFTNNLSQVAKYSGLLDAVLIRDEQGVVHIPELYYVPHDKVELEYKNPGSQERVWGKKWQSMWAQSLYIVAKLLQHDYVEVGELDPLNKRYNAVPRPDVIVQVALLCENPSLKKDMKVEGIEVETIHEACLTASAPMSILPAKALSSAYQHLGVSKKMSLTGRPQHKMGILGTSQMYNILGNFYAFTPQFVDQEQFYLWLDNELLVDLIKTDIAYLRSNWKKLGRPTMVLPIMRLMLGERSNWNRNPVWKLIEKLKSGYVAGTRIMVGQLSELIHTSCISKMTFLEGPKKSIIPMEFRKRVSTVVKARIQRLSSFMEPSPVTSRKTATLPDEVKGAVRRNRRTIFKMDSPKEVPTASELAAVWSQRRSTSGHLAMSSSFSGLISPGHSRRNSFTGVEVTTLLDILQSSEDIQVQADILHHIYTNNGGSYSFYLQTGEMVTVTTLLEELYQKACSLRMWSLVRHTAGLLRKKVEDLAQGLSDLLVRQKLVSVGLVNPAYGGMEMEIARPLSSTELLETIEKGCGSHHSATVISQEIIVYLAMFIRLEPDLFKDIWRIHIGIIMSIVVQELVRATKNSVEDATDVLLSLSPCGLKNLLYNLLSGREYRIDQFNMGEMEPQISIIAPTKRDMSKQLRNDVSVLGSIDEEPIEEKVGVWRRRRRLDGALNRIPAEFYTQVWYILERCDAIQMGHHHLPSRPTIEEMTAGELKFAVQVEKALNSLSHPEYRQLVVEALMLVAIVVQQDRGQGLGRILVVDHVIQAAHTQFLEDQRKSKGPSMQCCCEALGKCHGPMGICIHFYDSAPSGRYGTMTYTTAALVEKLKWIPTMTSDCKVS